MDYTSIVDFEIADLSLIDNKISLKIKDSELDLKDDQNFKKINANVNIYGNNIKLNDLSIVLDNSFFEGNLFVKNFNDLELLKFDGDITNKSKITSSDFIEGSAENSFNFNVKFEGDFNQIFLNNSKQVAWSAFVFHFKSRSGIDIQNIESEQHTRILSSSIISILLKFEFLSIMLFFILGFKAEN